VAICKICGTKYSKWTTPVSARGKCSACFNAELSKERDAEQQERVLAPPIIEQEKRSVRIRFRSFVPRSRSKIVFVVAMASYALTMAGLLYTIARAFGAQRPPLGVMLRHGYPALEVMSLVVIAPIVESLLLIGIIELLRWLRFPIWLQMSCSAGVSALLHTPLSHALVVAPSWFIMAAAYLIWRQESWKVGFVIIACIHALFNLNPAIQTISYAMHHRTV
jgi:hypothetical protein